MQITMDFDTDAETDRNALRAMFGSLFGYPGVNLDPDMVPQKETPLQAEAVALKAKKNAKAKPAPEAVKPALDEPAPVVKPEVAPVEYPVLPIPSKDAGPVAPASAPYVTPSESELKTAFSAYANRKSVGLAKAQALLKGYGVARALELKDEALGKFYAEITAPEAA